MTILVVDVGWVSMPMSGPLRGAAEMDGKASRASRSSEDCELARDESVVAVVEKIRFWVALAPDPAVIRRQKIHGHGSTPGNSPYCDGAQKSGEEVEMCAAGQTLAADDRNNHPMDSPRIPMGWLRAVGIIEAWPILLLCMRQNVRTPTAPKTVH
uniref:Uncharacterized protein n=1 Tax=Romanomermis culicivorax TaxID=13658 RepID=A0A915K0G9_ROMCU